MKKLVVVILLMLGAASVFAGGDQNQGDKGKGAVHQVVGP